MSKVWMYHPDEGAKLFNSFDDVPDGWFDSPDFKNARVVETQKEVDPEQTKAAAVQKGRKRGSKKGKK